MVDNWGQRLSLRVADESDVPQLRVLVNAAYRELAEMGLNFTGTYQDEAETRARMQGKEVVLAHVDGVLVGTVSLGVEQDDGQLPVLYIGQFAVAPDHKRRGIGRFLLNHAEQRARERGVTRLQLDTAVPAQHLVRLYQSLGYQVIDEVQWGGKTYRTYIMEKRLE